MCLGSCGSPGVANSWRLCADYRPSSAAIVLHCSGIWMARHNDHMSTAVTFVCYTIHVFAYLLATSKQRDRVGGAGREEEEERDRERE